MDWTWDLSIFYDGFDDPKIKTDLAALRAIPSEADAVFEAQKPARQTLEALMELMEKTSALIERLASYPQLTQAVDATNERAAQLYDEVMQLLVPIEMMNSKYVRYLGTVENLEELIKESPALSAVGFALRKDRENAEHLLPEDVEPWMLKMSLSGGMAFSKLRDMLDGTLLVDYDGAQIPLSAARAKAYDPNPAVRKAAYEAEIASYKKIEIPMAAALNGVKGEALTMAEAKKYPDVLSMSLKSSNMEKETLEAMFTAIREALPKFRAYLRKKGEWLGHNDGLPFYDLFAPVAAQGYEPKKYTVDEAHDKLVLEMGKFSKDMADFIDHAFKNRWIDMFPREGKGGGAFCSEVHSMKQSRVMTNFAGSFSDVSTIAHELGHAWHNRQMEPLPYMMIGTPMPLAETASIFNETLLAHAVRGQADKKEVFTLLEGELMENTQTVVDIYSRFLFESAVIEGRKTHTLSVNELKALMLDAQDKSYGDGLDKAVRHPYMWACKVHYYSPDFAFYNFPYAFGLLFGKGMFAKYLEKGAAFVPEYNQILKMCGSAPVKDVAAAAGIDVNSVDFWRSALKPVTDDIDLFIRLADELK